MLNEIVLIGFFFLFLIYSIIVHEVSHGIMALWLGDPTAKYAGRLNLNPIKHIDFFGSILVPIMMYLSLGVAFGWAKPVPYNPYNLKNQKWDPVFVAFAGPVSNLSLALIFSVIGRLITIPMNLKNNIVNNIGNFSDLASNITESLGAIFFVLCVMIIFWNVLLAVFNLIPIPPLDGSKLLYALLPIKPGTLLFLEQFGFVILFLVIIIDNRTFHILSSILKITWLFFLKGVAI